MTSDTEQATIEEANAILQQEGEIGPRELAGRIDESPANAARIIQGLIDAGKYDGPEPHIGECDKCGVTSAWGDPIVLSDRHEGEQVVYLCVGCEQQFVNHVFRDA